MPTLTHGDLLILLAIQLGCTFLIVLINSIGIVGNIRRENKALIAALEAQRRG